METSKQHGTLPSEQVIQASPMTFRGARKRIWGLTRRTDDAYLRVALGAVAIVLIAIAWVFLAIGDIIGFFLPSRLQLVIANAQAKSSRRGRAEAMRHKELVEELQAVRRQLELANPDAQPTAEMPLLPRSRRRH